MLMLMLVLMLASLVRTGLKIALTSWGRSKNQSNHELTKSGRGGLRRGSFFSTAISAKAKVTPSNRNSIREFILSTVFVDSQNNVASTARARTFISL